MKRSLLLAAAAIGIGGFLTSCSSAPSINSMAQLEAAFEEAGGNCSEASPSAEEWQFFAGTIGAEVSQICTYGEGNTAVLSLFASKDEKDSYLEHFDSADFDMIIEHGDRWIIDYVNASDYSDAPLIGGKHY